MTEIHLHGKTGTRLLHSASVLHLVESRSRPLSRSLTPDNASHAKARSVSADELLSVIADSADLAALHADGSAVLHVTLSAEMFEALCVHGAGEEELEAVSSSGTTDTPHRPHARPNARMVAAPDWSEEFRAEVPRRTLDITRVTRYTPRESASHEPVSHDSVSHDSGPHRATGTAAE